MSFLHWTVARGLARGSGFGDDGVGGFPDLCDQFIAVVNLSHTDGARHVDQSLKDARLRVGAWKLVLEKGPEAVGKAIIERRRRAGVGGLNMCDQALFDFSTSWQGLTMRPIRHFLKSKEWVFVLKRLSSPV